MRDEKMKLYKVTAVSFFAYFTLLVVCYLVLADAFQFPDILRRPTEEVMARFSAHANVIRTAYWFFTMSGLVLIIFSVLMGHILDQRDIALVRLATVFGIVCGVLQMIGFVRWPVYIPYLADVFSNPASSAAARDTAAMLYESANKYVGMAVGEHLGFIFQGLWQICISAALLREKLFDRKMAVTGIIIGLGVLVYSFEQLAGVFSMLEVLVMPVNVAWDIWILFMGYSLVRADAKTGEGPKLGWISLVVAVALFLLFVVPALINK